MWKYSDKNDKEGITLHDSFVNKACINKGDLFLDFEDGFWICYNNPLNPHGETCRTGLSRVVFRNCEIEKIYIYREFRILNKTILTRRSMISADALIKNINGKKWKLEFIEEYYANKSGWFNCSIRNNGKPFYLECQLELFFDDMEYYWNKICADRSW